MQRKTRVIVAVAAAIGLVAAGSGVAQAAKPWKSYHQPVVHWVAPVVHAIGANGTAVVHADYQCAGGSANTHLFIGVKQGPQVNATTHTSSEFANTFYSTNWNSDGPGLRLVCDGRAHNRRFVVKPDPYWAKAGSNPPALHAGRAFIQFCVFDSTNTGDDDPNGFAFNYTMKKVVQN